MGVCSVLFSVRRLSVGHILLIGIEDVIIRIYRFAPHENLIMEVGPGCLPGFSNISDHIPPLNFLAITDQDFR